ncbi:MAG: TonB-dependent receptor plug domain-containing protein [Aphanocapsa sp. GSE-SYN-MK-11-07L]|nr:TonB-dependent receptor plug domain-containing protein [Aphanocapsa sp. GSE-SYN-MK-11-07L]
MAVSLRLWVVVGVLSSLGSVAGALPGWAQTETALQPSEPMPDQLRSNHEGHSQPATTVKDWLAQIEAATVQVTNIKLERTETGLEIILETGEGKPLQVDATKFRAEGNSLIADIPNAVLALPEGQAFAAENPTTDIATVQVAQADASSIRISVTGTNAPPQTEVTLKTGGFAYSLNPEDETTEEELVVTGEGEGRYFVPDTSTATKTDTPIRDLPVSIQIVPQQVLRDRNVRNITEAVETVSGVLDGGSLYGSSAATRIIRGFSSFDGAQAANFRNGSRDVSFYGLTPIGTVEQVEILKGPASVLFGAIEPGGIINITTKQPLNQPYYKLGFEVGNYGFYQPSIDFSGPLTGDKRLLYRFIASCRGQESYQDFVNLNTTTIAPSLTWKIGDRTTLNLYYEYIRFFASPSLLESPILSNNRFPSRNFFPAYPDFSSGAYTTHKYGYTLTHEFSDNWKIRNNLAINQSINIRNDNIAANLVDDRFLTLQSFNGENTWDTYFGQIDLIGKFNTGSIKHQLLIGFDVTRNDFWGSPVFFSDDFPPLDIRNPNYNRPVA